MSSATIAAKKNQNVCAITVGYNSPDELTRLLLSLENQNDCLSGLVIIDNSDDRHSLANKRIFNFHSKKYFLARYHKTENNVGSAGGFRRGMKIAHENGFQWMWLLDQDGVISSGCLTELLRHAEEGDILCPNIFDIERPQYSLPKAYAVNLLGGWYPAIWGLTHSQIRAFGTHGALISRKTLDTIGYYDDSLFFVGFEDLDFGYRATQAGLVIVLVLEAEALHWVQVSSTRLAKLLPVDLHRIVNPHEVRPCMKTKSISAFAQAYFESKRLNPWQFGIALVYSMCRGLYYKITSDDGVALKKTLHMWLKCLAYCVKKDWPYSLIDQLCRAILR